MFRGAHGPFFSHSLGFELYIVLPAKSYMHVCALFRLLHVDVDVCSELSWITTLSVKPLPTLCVHVFNILRILRAQKLGRYLRSYDT